MRTALLYHAYTDGLRAIRAADPQWAQHDEAALRQQLAALTPYFRGYELAFAQHGWPAASLPVNVPELLQAWCRENGRPYADAETAVLDWLRHHQPEVLFYAPHYSHLLARIRDGVPGIRCVVVPANSPVHDVRLFQLADVVIGCIPNYVQRLRAQGLRAHHVHHGFPTHVWDEVAMAPPQARHEFNFVGSIVREAGFHRQREQLLLQLARHVPMRIYTAGYTAPPHAGLRLLAKRVAYAATLPVRTLPPLAQRLSALRGPLGEAFRLRAWPQAPVAAHLRPYLAPPRFGLDMFRTYGQTLGTLNLHIDISAGESSNLRMFEAPGMGACLLTEASRNLADLYEADREVLTYNSAGECLEKARWLLAHPAEAAAIGAAGQARVRRAHRQDQRVGEWVDLLCAEIRTA